jgi:DNA-binding response OmpR family regulator
MPGILIVEDEKDLKEILKISLLKRNFTIFEANNGKEAISHFKPALTDLVITDLIMPEEDGLKVIIKLREMKPSIKIIAISGGGKAGPGNYLNLAKALGADAVYSKPFSINEIVARVEEFVNVGQNPKLIV